MTIKPLENVKSFAVSRPPLVVFMVCVSALAIAFMSLAYYIKMNQITDPDITQDWNTFLLNFGKMDFCVSDNDTLKHYDDDVTPTTTGPSSKPEKEILESEPMKNVSVTIMLTLDPMKNFVGFPHNVTHLQATISGEELGLHGSEALEEVNVTFTLPTAWSTQDCAKKGQCSEAKFKTCVTFMASPAVFPTTRKPETCHADSFNNNTATSVYYTTWIQPLDPLTPEDHWCPSGVFVKAYHALNPELSVMMSAGERSLVNLHLLHTSYFLFVMVITVFCYAVIRGRPSKPRAANSMETKVPVEA
ncbi:transmembrane protein 248-like [Branchiostoma floridae]|uniref:Transmembrane protein 248-like n=2 Tax=Branchiostoma floridae TaxID=7739 RepID=A0A9J7M0V1_BRAFL|nr:transmembrane protein 248-like [Branchiostoma floridae]